MSWRSAMAAGVIGLAWACTTPAPPPAMSDPLYPTDASWEELPPHIRVEHQLRSGPADDYDEPPYPLGGMRTFLRHLEYPDDARRDGAQGRVVVYATIDAQGHVATAQVLSSVHPALDRTAIVAVRETPFRPAMKDGRPVEGSIAIPVRFTFAKSEWRWWPFGH